MIFQAVAMVAPGNTCQRQPKTDPLSAGRFLADGRNTSHDHSGVVLSSRRVKRGPGRRPQSAKRQRFMELRERGWSILAAAREVGRFPDYG